MYLCSFITRVGWRSGNMSDCVISGFHREIDENGALLGYYAASNVTSLPTFRDNLSVPCSRVKILTPDNLSLGSRS